MTSTQSPNQGDRMKEPIYHNNCWECPECHTSNPPPGIILTSMPPQTPYYCMSCDYRYHYVPDYSPEYPIGKKIQTSEQKVDDDE